MKREFLLRAIGEIDDAYVTAADSPRSVRRVRWTRYAAAAACLLVVGAGVLLLVRSGGVAMNSAETAGEMFLLNKSDFAYVADAEADAAPGDGKEIGNAAPEAMDTEIALDTGVGETLTEVTFRFWNGKEFESRTHKYPDGIPGAKEILNDYLAEAGTAVRCTHAEIKEVGATTVVHDGGIVQHTPGVRVMQIYLDGNPGETVLRGLSETVRRRGSVFYAQQVAIFVGSETVLEE